MVSPGLATQASFNSNSTTTTSPPSPVFRPVTEFRCVFSPPFSSSSCGTESPGPRHGQRKVPSPRDCLVLNRAPCTNAANRSPCVRSTMAGQPLDPGSRYDPPLRVLLVSAECRVVALHPLARKSRFRETWPCQRCRQCLLDPEEATTRLPAYDRPKGFFPLLLPPRRGPSFALQESPRARPDYAGPPHTAHHQRRSNRVNNQISLLKPGTLVA